MQQKWRQNLQQSIGMMHSDYSNLQPKDVATIVSLDITRAKKLSGLLELVHCLWLIMYSTRFRVFYVNFGFNCHGSHNYENEYSLQHLGGWAPRPSAVLGPNLFTHMARTHTSTHSRMHTRTHTNTHMHTHKAVSTVPHAQSVNTVTCTTTLGGVHSPSLYTIYHI